MPTKVNNPIQQYSLECVEPPQQNAGVTSTYTADRVYLTMFEVPVGGTYSKVTFINGATIAGDVRIGIYKKTASTLTCAGGTLLIESAATAHAGASSLQTITFPTSIYLEAGTYYFAAQVSDATATIMKLSTNNYQTATGIKERYDLVGGFGPFTNPCPAVTDNALTAAHITGLSLLK